VLAAPTRQAEKARIESSGGRVFAVEYEDGISGPPRVWLKAMDIPGLAMSRSIGDTVAHTAGVISEPEIFEYDIQPNDKYIIVASDGLWEFMTSQQVRACSLPTAAAAATATATGPVLTSRLCDVSQQVIDFIRGVPEPKKAVDMLVVEAAARWMKEESVIDDTTIIVAYL
jgi:serine/threonine protein phosphatase PrpC